MRAPHRDPEDIYRRPPSPADQLAGLDLFAAASSEPSPTVAEAEAEIRRDFLGQAPAEAPAPAEREAEQTQAFDPEPLSDREFAARVALIQEALREPLVELAKRRIPQPNDEAGVTAKDARDLAAARGFGGLLGTKQRAWSWLSVWLGRLAREGALCKYRRSGLTVRRMGDNGNEHVVYLHPYDPRARDEVAA